MKTLKLKIIFLGILLGFLPRLVLAGDIVAGEAIQKFFIEKELIKVVEEGLGEDPELDRVYLVTEDLKNYYLKTALAPEGEPQLVAEDRIVDLLPQKVLDDLQAEIDRQTVDIIEVDVPRIMVEDIIERAQHDPIFTRGVDQDDTEDTPQEDPVDNGPEEGLDNPQPQDPNPVLDPGAGDFNPMALSGSGKLSCSLHTTSSTAPWRNLGLTLLLGALPLMIRKAKRKELI